MLEQLKAFLDTACPCPRAYQAQCGLLMSGPDTRRLKCHAVTLPFLNGGHDLIRRKHSPKHS